MDLKQSLQAILFASAKRLTTHKLAILTRKPEDKVDEALVELEKEINSGSQPMKLVHEGDTWRLSVKEQFLPVVRKIVKKTELPKSILETLAVVAYKAPVLQSEVIKIRTNKAYDHLNYLEENGYVGREKKGRTKLIKLTQKFFDYFDIDEQKLKNKFSIVKEMEKKINEQERNPESTKPQIYESTRIETYDNPITSGVTIEKETLNGLPVYESEHIEKTFNMGEPPTKEELEEYLNKKVEAGKADEKPITAKEIIKLEHEIEKNEKEKPSKFSLGEIDKAAEEHAKQLSPKKFETKGLFSEKKPEKFEEKVDKRVAEIIGEKPDNNEENNKRNGLEKTDGKKE